MFQTNHVPYWIPVCVCTSLYDLFGEENVFTSHQCRDLSRGRCAGGSTHHASAICWTISHWVQTWIPSLSSNSDHPRTVLPFTDFMDSDRGDSGFRYCVCIFDAKIPEGFNYSGNKLMWRSAHDLVHRLLHRTVLNNVIH